MRPLPAAGRGYPRRRVHRRRRLHRPVDRHHAQGARSRARRGAGRGRSLRRRRQRPQRRLRAVLVGQVLHPGTAVRTNRGDPPGQGLRGQHPGHRRLLPALRRRGRLPAGRHPLYRHQPGPGRQHRQRDRRSGAPRHQLLRQAPAGRRAAPGRLAQAPGGLVLAGCRDGATRQAGSRPAPGRPATGGTPVRRHADARTGARPPGGSGHPPTGGSSPAAWCWR